MHESSFTRSVNKLLPTEIYAWKINARFAPGVPDCWYSGPGGSLWAEWKVVPKMPKKLRPKLSGLQRLWLNSRYDEGRSVIVIVGSPEGIVILENKAWDEPFKVGTLLTKRETAAWLTTRLGTQACT